MSDAITAGLSRQSGLLKELRVIATNVANASTDGYRREATVFTEHVDRDADLSLGAMRGRWADRAQGGMTATGGTYDLAIEGPGMFAVRRHGEVLLTRAGAFQTDADGTLVTKQGWPVLDEGGGPIEVPPETSEVTVSPDGTVSLDGLATARIGVFEAPPGTLTRAGDTLLRPTGGYAALPEPRVHQGLTERSNVDPVTEIARLTEAQRLFEAGQDLMNTEHKRLEDLIRLIGEGR